MDDLKLRILIVEDIKIAQKIAIMAIKPLGCEIHIAETGAKAISLFSQYQYDLIFMDLGLPDMDGLTIAETLRKQEEGSNKYTSIIALTVHTADEFKQSTVNAGMDDFISKPLTMEKAQEIITKYAIPQQPQPQLKPLPAS